jgi:hypothetical protein
MTIFGSGHQIVTSTTRPASPIEGQVIYETNTDKAYVCTDAAVPTWTEIIRSGTAAGGSLTGTYPNPTLAANSVGSSQIIDGSIALGDLATSAKAWGQYLAFFTWSTGQYQQITTTVTIPTRSLCIFSISPTAYSTFVGGPFTQYAQIDGVTSWNQYSAYFHNNTYDHRTYPTGYMAVGLTAGTYTFRLYTPSGQTTDSNDYALVGVWGYPY